MATFLQDTFTGTDGTALTSHTGETGATWSRAPGDEAGGSAGIVITSNRAAPAQTNDEISKYYASGSPASADYYVEAVCVMPNSAPTQDYFGVWARHDTSAHTGYTLNFHRSSAQWTIRKRLAGTESQLGSAVGGTSDNTTYVARLTVSGTGGTVTLTAQIQRTSDSKYLTSAGTWQASATDAISTSDSSSPITSAGKAAIQLRNRATCTTFDSVVGVDSGGGAQVVPLGVLLPHQGIFLAHASGR